MNLGIMLSKAAARRPESPAFIWGDSTTNYGEAEERTGALAHALTELGLKPGDRVGVLMHNRPEVIESFFATWKAGGAVVPLNARFVASEVSYHLWDSRAVAVIFDSDFSEMIEQLSGALPSLNHCICVGDPLAGQLAYDDLIASELGEVSSHEAGDDDLAWLFYTSGTTGRPKGAMLTHGNLTFMAVSWLADLMHLEPEDVALHAAPLTHGAGFHSIPLVLKGSAQVILKPARFSPEAFCTCVEKHGVTNTWLVPTQIKMLLGYSELEKWNLSSLKWLVYGAAPMYPGDIKEAMGRLGPVLVQLYGQGETPMTATYLSAKDHAVQGPEEQRLASCGIARSGTEVSILDDEGHHLPSDSLGEICVRGPSVMKGYWERPEATAAVLRNGWLRTGDIGRMDEHGFVYILDRNKDMIISGGSNVYPREVEEIMLQHPAIDEACVIGVPDDLWGEAVKAIIVLKPGCEMSLEEVLSFASGRMAAYKKPKSVEFVDVLPKNAYGKVLKRVLREQYPQG
jgi:acyl-CoA synthetase (AMP-forming)/AMP-acid ligase II